MSTLDGKPLAMLTCTIPPSGSWWAVVLIEPGVVTPVLGATTLAIADLSLVGAIVRVEEEAPAQVRVVVYGGAGWRLPLERAESWQSGVKIRAVLEALQRGATAARATAGLGGAETVTMPADKAIGGAFGWPVGGPYAPSTGAMVLDALVRRGALPTWRVEPGGGTVVTEWPSTGAADGKARVLRRSMVNGSRSLGLDVAARALLPGATIEGVGVRRVTFRESAGELRAEVFER